MRLGETLLFRASTILQCMVEERERGFVRC
jgi:hypothetical protein